MLTNLCELASADSYNINSSCDYQPIDFDIINSVQYQQLNPILPALEPAGPLDGMGAGLGTLQLNIMASTNHCASYYQNLANLAQTDFGQFLGQIVADYKILIILCGVSMGFGVLWAIIGLPLTCCFCHRKAIYQKNACNRNMCYTPLSFYINIAAISVLSVIVVYVILPYRASRRIELTAM